MTRKVGTQLLVSPHVKERQLALALVRDEAQAEVGRALFEKALPLIERPHSQALDTLRESFRLAGYGDNYGEALALAVKHGVTYRSVTDATPAELRKLLGALAEA